MQQIALSSIIGAPVYDNSGELAGHVREVVVACQHRQVVMDAKSGQQRVDRADLYPGPPAAVAYWKELSISVPEPFLALPFGLLVVLERMRRS